MAAKQDETAVKTYEYKIRHNAAFLTRCEDVLEHCRQIYNAALQERISCYQVTGKGLSCLTQSKHLTEARELPEVSVYLRNTQQDTLEKLEQAYQRFFEALKEAKLGQKVGLPRFKGKHRYHTFSQKLEKKRGNPLNGDVLTVPGVGKCRLRLSRPIQGTVKQVRITRRADGWYALLVCEMVKPEPLPPTHESVGIDVGIKSFATFSTGESIKNPRYYTKAQRKLAKTQKLLSRKKKGSKNRAKQRIKVAKEHLHVARSRKDFQHKLSTRLVNEFDSIAVEKLNIKGLVKNKHLSKAIMDVAWGQFLSLLKVKAENAGREFIERNPRQTSMTCSRCGHVQKMPLAIRKFQCGNDKCKLIICRDVNAAINIKVGLGKPKLTTPVELNSSLTTKQERVEKSRYQGGAISA